jgi:hypothetical protein
MKPEGVDLISCRPLRSVGRLAPPPTVLAPYIFDNLLMSEGMKDSCEAMMSP